MHHLAFTALNCVNTGITVNHNYFKAIKSNFLYMCIILII